jgi:hypothetical protein
MKGPESIGCWVMRVRTTLAQHTRDRAYRSELVACCKSERQAGWLALLVFFES